MARYDFSGAMGKPIPSSPCPVVDDAGSQRDYSWLVGVAFGQSTFEIKGIINPMGMNKYMRVDLETVI